MNERTLHDRPGRLGVVFDRKPKHIMAQLAPGENPIASLPNGREGNSNYFETSDPEVPNQVQVVKCLTLLTKPFSRH